MTKAKAIEILNELFDSYLTTKLTANSGEDKFGYYHIILRDKLDEITDKKIALLTAIDALKQDSSIEAEHEKGWISVKDRLPDKNKSVLCCVFGRSVGEGIYRGFGGFDGRHHVWYMYAISGMYWDNEVTHWHPLPEPPESAEIMEAIAGSETPDKAERRPR